MSRPPSAGGHGREVRDAELFGTQHASPHIPRPLRSPATPRKRKRVPSHPTDAVSSVTRQRLPQHVELNQPPNVSCAGGASSSAASARALITETSLLPQVPMYSNHYLANRLKLLERGELSITRTVQECFAQFCPPPWRYHRSHEDGLRMNGVQRLSEMALSAARAHASSGQMRDFSMLPDDFAHAVLANVVSPNALIRLEKDNPTRVAVIEAAWARIVKQEFSVEELPQDCDWWRTFYELRKTQEEERLREASERLRLRYNQADSARQARNVTSAPLMLSNTRLGRRRRGSSGPQAPQNLLARLRFRMRRERLQRR